MSKLDYPFTVRPLTLDEGGGYLLEFPDLPGCIADGETIDEALAEAQDALKSWLKTSEKFGDAIPKPSTADQFSGQWRIRVPKSLHAQLTLRAKQEGVSLNTLSATLLAAGISNGFVGKGNQSSHS